ncbi:NmrA family NAD(P)-binding protein [Actinomadura macrotermitis]|uniref:NAD(P)H azoreductase n=1 Tax=Actinomadura macrotermitis TaxID=2585200 RepID=A0A7K0BYM4_9ACTN|nr:NAD(P)H-binding protein [Actinomadura macrotermitis]MQY05744.1 NAD(P)H azoreductase [Actinomadura macrotermitis]
MNTVVIGATGKTGRPVVEALAARGVRARAASRHPAGPDGVRFDWADRATWEPALRGAEALYLVGPYALPDGAGLPGELLAAAPGVRRVVLLSALGADVAGDELLMAGWEADVRASGREWTVLRPNWFLQNFDEGAFAGLLRETGTLALPADDAPVAFVDTRDVGEVAAAALTEDGHGGRTYVLSGPEALTHAAVAESLGAAAGRDVRYVPIDEEQHAAALRAAGADEGTVAGMRALFRMVRDGVFAPVTGTVEQVTGRPPRSLKAYAEERAAAWRP